MLRSQSAPKERRLYSRLHDLPSWYLCGAILKRNAGTMAVIDVSINIVSIPNCTNVNNSNISNSFLFHYRSILLQTRTFILICNILQRHLSCKIRHLLLNTIVLFHVCFYQCSFKFNLSSSANFPRLFFSKN